MVSQAVFSCAASAGRLEEESDWVEKLKTVVSGAPADWAQTWTTCEQGFDLLRINR
jgi:hypothetical protein